jgi:hypothetical protein
MAGIGLGNGMNVLIALTRESPRNLCDYVNGVLVISAQTWIMPICLANYQ